MIVELARQRSSINNLLTNKIGVFQIKDNSAELIAIGSGSTVTKFNAIGRFFTVVYLGLF